MAALVVYCGARRVGSLSERQRELVFEYAPEWREAEDGFAISVSLPLSSGPRATAFFGNLLPEGPVRELVARRVGVSYDNDFALLARIGGECAGALSVLPEGQDPNEATGDRERLRPEDLKRLAESGGAAAWAREGTRLSLAGAQDKLPVIVEEGELFLPIGNAPSTHILKFPNPRFGHLVENEVFTTELFRALGLPCVTVRLLRERVVSLCLVTRYDRLRGPSAVVRLHQEDLCQALGLGSQNKYELEGGPDLSRIHHCLRQVSAEPLLDTRILLDWWAACLLLGNSDGHAKNLSLIYHRPTSLRLAPLYDLVCTRVYPRLDRRLALSAVGEADPGQIGPAQLRRLGSELGVTPRYLVSRVRSLAERVADVLNQVIELQQERHGRSSMYSAIERVVRRQARRTERLLVSE